MSIIDLLKDIPLSAVLKEKIGALESENETLKAQLSQAQEKARTLEEKISHILTSQEYIEESGAFFKRRENGEWDYTPYCPSCQTAMVQPKRHELYVCGKKSCGQRASFTRVNDVVSRLPNP